MRRCRRWLALALVVSGLWPAAVAALDGTGPVVEVASDRLPNGLELYDHEEHTAPVLCVVLWYRLGSRHELIARRGIGHLLEHMMCTGSQRVGTEEQDPINDQDWGEMNALAAADTTVYWNKVPAPYL